MSGGPADLLFLGGSIDTTAATFTVTRSAKGWEVDAGTVHGLRAPQGDEAFELACTAPDGTAAGLVKVVSVGVSRSRVEPIDWEPADIAYRSFVASSPLPPATVSFDPPPEDASASSTAGDIATEAYPVVRDAIATAGPDGTRPRTSTKARRAPPCTCEWRPTGTASAFLPQPSADATCRKWPTPARASAPARRRHTGGCGRERSRQGERAVGGRATGAHRAVGADPRSGRPAVVAGRAIRLDVYEAGSGEQTLPEGRTPLALTDGGYQLAYRTSGSSWVNPAVFLTLTNTTIGHSGSRCST